MLLYNKTFFTHTTAHNIDSNAFHDSSCYCAELFVLYFMKGIVQNMDWTVGLDNWTGQLDWTAGLDSWTGLLDWDSFLLNRRNSMFSRKAK